MDKNPNYNIALYHKERILHSMGRFSESISCCDKILLDYPTNADVLFDKSASLAMENKIDESLKTLEQAITFAQKFKIKAKNNKSFVKLIDNPEFQKLVS